jgi:hypothetical protein
MAGFSVSNQGFGQDLLPLTSPAFSYVNYSCCGCRIAKFADITGVWLAWFGMELISTIWPDSVVADFGLQQCMGLSSICRSARSVMIAVSLNEMCY